MFELVQYNIGKALTRINNLRCNLGYKVSMVNLLVKAGHGVVVALVLGLSGLCVATGSHGEDALLMPLASQSLLLDITRAGSRFVAVGERGHILYSDDKGESWQQASVPTRQMLTAVYFPSSLRGWAVGHDGLILMTVDGGEHWVLQRNGLEDQVLINRRKLDDLEALHNELEQALLDTDEREDRELLQLELEDLALDLEDAQFLLEEPVNAPPLLDVYFGDELSGVAVGAFNTLLYTLDGGLNWTLGSANVDNPDEFHLNAVTGNGAGGYWIAGEGGVLFRAADISGEWQTLPSPYPGSWFGIAVVPRGEILLAFGLRGNAWRSVDGGQQWQRIDLGTERSLAGGVFVNGSYALLVGSVGSLWVSVDGGRSFRDRTLESRSNLSAVSCAGDRALVVGQDGVQATDCFGVQND